MEYATPQLGLRIDVHQRSSLQRSSLYSYSGYHTAWMTASKLIKLELRVVVKSSYSVSVHNTSLDDGLHFV